MSVVWSPPGSSSTPNNHTLDSEITRGCHHGAEVYLGELLRLTGHRLTGKQRKWRFMRFRWPNFSVLRQQVKISCEKEQAGILDYFPSSNAYYEPRVSFFKCIL
jgi:hypothetical protein